MYDPSAPEPPSYETLYNQPELHVYRGQFSREAVSHENIVSSYVQNLDAVNVRYLVFTMLTDIHLAMPTPVLNNLDVYNFLEHMPGGCIHESGECTGADKMFVFGCALIRELEKFNHFHNITCQDTSTPLAYFNRKIYNKLSATVTTVISMLHSIIYVQDARIITLDTSDGDFMYKTLDNISKVGYATNIYPYATYLYDNVCLTTVLYIHVSRLQFVGSEFTISPYVHRHTYSDNRKQCGLIFKLLISLRNLPYRASKSSFIIQTSITELIELFSRMRRKYKDKPARLTYKL